MFNNLLSQAQEIRDKLAYTAIQGDSSAVQLIIVTEFQQILVQPYPRVEPVSISPEPVEGINDLRGVVKKFDVSGVSKSYTRDLFEKEETTFLINDEPCHMVPGTVKDNVLTWSFQLQVALIEQEDFYA